MIHLLNESRDYNLYHGTTINSLINIINTDQLRGVSSYVYKKNKIVIGMSLTRDIRFAKSWIKNQVIIVFDANKLHHNNRLINRGAPNIFSKVGSSKLGKSEEFLVIDKPITDVKKYIIKVLVKEGIEQQDKLIQGLEEEGIEVGVYK